jgi:translation initiation factor 3 subunit H
LDLEQKTQKKSGKKSLSFERLDFSKENKFLEKNLEFLIDCLEDLSSEQQRFQLYQKALQKQSNQNQQSSGMKPPMEPSRFDSLLINQQMDIYCNQINFFSKNCFAKLFLNKQNYFSSSSSSSFPSSSDSKKKEI